MSLLFFQKVVNKSEIKKELKHSFIKEAIEYIKYFLKVLTVVLIAYIFIKNSIFDTFRVDGQSMSPNYQDKEKVYIDKITPKFGEYQRGDVVIVDMPIEHCNNNTDDQKWCFFIKRIIGLPGEQVMIRDGDVFILNDKYKKGVLLDETKYLDGNINTYINVTSGTEEFKSDILQDDEYFVMGDNRMGSKDSRKFGEITKSMIVGKDFYRPRTGFFDEPLYNIANN